MSELEPKVYPKRTNQQNKALHVLFNLLAGLLNENGLDMRRTLKPGVDIPWSGATVKQWLWKPIMEAQLDKKSTTELTTVEIDQVFDTINRHIGQQFGLHAPFPCIQDVLYQLEAERQARLEQEKIFKEDHERDTK